MEKIMSKPQYRNAGKKWTPSEEQELLTNIQQYRGNVREISDVHGRSETAVNIRIASLMKKLLDQHPKEAVAGMFYKTEEEMDELLAHVDRSSKTNRQHSTQEVIERLDRIEEAIMRLIKITKKTKSKKK
jgi:hypothetical protein